MPKLFHKLKECGCIIEAMVCGINKDKMYMLGGHKHFTICKTCKQDENEQDTLYDMWRMDNITNDFEYARWKEWNPYTGGGATGLNASPAP